MTLGEARRLVNVGQRALDKCAGLPIGTTADLERGKNKNPSHSIVTRITWALQRLGLAGISAQELFPVEMPTLPVRRRAAP